MCRRCNSGDVAFTAVMATISVLFAVLLIIMVGTVVYNAGWYDGKKAGRAEYRELNTPSNYFGHLS